MSGLLLFLCGTGLGSLLAILAVLLMLQRAGQNNAARSEVYNRRTVELMEQRNRTDREIAESLKRIASEKEIERIERSAR